MSLTFSDEDAMRCAASFPSGKKYKVIYADPPWEYSSTGNLKEKPYRTMKMADLRAMPVASVCDRDCALFLWTANPLLDEAIDLMKGWGFKFKTVYKVWTKRNTKSGTPAITPGHWSLGSTELLLLGVRGAMQKYKRVFNDRQEVAAPRGRHSEKPESIRDDIRRLLEVDNRLEMFSRHVCDGWDAWGLDVPSFVHYESAISKGEASQKVRAALRVGEGGGVLVELRVVDLAAVGSQTEMYTAKEPMRKERPKKKGAKMSENKEQ